MHILHHTGQRPHRTALGFLVAGLLAGPAVQAAVYYVDPSIGNDANVGSTESAPWRTVQKAAATLNAGDTVYLKNGTYALNTHPTARDLTPARSGSAAAGYITYAAFPGHTPILDGGNARLPGGGLVNIRNKEYIRISGLTVQNVDDDDEGIGIYVDNSRHIIIEHNHVRHTDSSGIQVFTKAAVAGLPSADILIDGNDVEDTNRGGPNEMITVAGVDRFEVRNNRCHNRTVGTTGGEGIDVKQGSKNGTIHHNEVWDLHTNRPGIYIDAWDQLTENIDLYSNHVHGIDNHALYIGSERGGLLRNVRIYNNVVHDNYRAGIYFPDDTGFSRPEPLENILIANNTFARNGVTINWYGAIHVANASINGLQIRNNIAFQNGRYQIYDLPAGVTNAVIRDNLLWGDTGTADNARVGSGADAKADPLLANAAGNDFHLLAGSPAIDSGVNAALPLDTFDQDGDANPTEPVPFDYALAPRIAGSRVDRGAYEEQGGMPPVNHAPSASALTLSGTVRAGQTLRAAYTYSDPDGHAESGTRYQWYRATTALGAGATAIGGAGGTTTAATGATYTLTTADQGQYIGVTLTPKDGALAGTPISAYTAAKVAAAKPPTLYEDAEDGAILGWAVSDATPAGARVENVADAERGGHVIRLTGSRLDNAFDLRKADGKEFANRTQFVATWSHKVAVNYRVQWVVKTASGASYRLRYRPIDGASCVRVAGTSTIDCPLGGVSKNGTWQTFTRDLSADLRQALPAETLAVVRYLSIRGSGRFDDIRLSSP